MMNRKPRIFVGSSTEAANIDHEVRSILENGKAEVIGWRDVCQAGDHPLDALLEVAHSVDGALLIATPDDRTVFRGQERITPRDNILFELGIFISQLGKHRAAIVLVPAPDGQAASLPSDLYGVTALLFESDKPAVNERRFKNWVDRVRADPAVAHGAVIELQALLGQALTKVPPAWHEYLDRYLLFNTREAIQLASRGQILLSPGQYYAAIYEEMDKASDKTDVLAIATLSSAFWTGDRDQEHYLKRNEAAVKRGAKIRRLFIVPDSEWDHLTPILRPQILSGIKIRRAALTISADVMTLEDMVMFRSADSGESPVFIAEPAFDNPRRIRRSRLLLDQNERERLRILFEQVWASAPEVNLHKLERTPELRDSDIEPARSMKSFRLDKPVVSCEEAAAAKYIPLENELKTLILRTSRGYVALNLPGDSAAAFRAVKSALEIEQACLASPDEIKALGLSPGTVCAVKAPVWDMPMLVSKRLLTLSFLSTNDGTLRGFYKFEPSVLLQAHHVMLGDFERSDSGATKGSGFLIDS
ncbi:MAG TPA: TIR domain-containing protein [Candidatus Angelobacter sp.]